MGLIHADSGRADPRKREWAALTARALVDTEAVNLFVPERVAVQLELEKLEKRELTTADGRHVLVPYLG